MDPVYVYNIGKATVGALQHFAAASTTMSKAASKNALETAKIYPNPAQNILNIELPDSRETNFSFEISNSIGRTMLKVNNERKIDVSHLPNGVYIGVLKVGDQTLVKNIIIER